jgi:hypothetical protein
MRDLRDLFEIFMGIGFDLNDGEGKKLQAVIRSKILSWKEANPGKNIYRWDHRCNISYRERIANEFLSSNEDHF